MFVFGFLSTYKSQPTAGHHFLFISFSISNLRLKIKYWSNVYLLTVSFITDSGNFTMQPSSKQGMLLILAFFILSSKYSL